jgi:hypothetical protein
MECLSNCKQLIPYSVLSVSFDSVAPARLIRRFSQPASPSELPVGSLSRPSPRPRFTLRANLRLLFLAPAPMLDCGQMISPILRRHFAAESWGMPTEASGVERGEGIGNF